MACGLVGPKQEGRWLSWSFSWSWVLAVGLALSGSRLSGQEPELPRQEQPPAEAEKAAPDEAPSLDRLDAYQEKRQSLSAILTKHGFDEPQLEQRESPTADELNRLIGGIQLLMDREAERVFEAAMEMSDAEERDRILERLREGRYSPEVSNRIDEEFKRRRLGEEGPSFPTIDEALERRRQLQQERREEQERRERQAREDLEAAKEQLLTDQMTEAAREFAEQDARRMVDASLRLVMRQRLAQLREVIRRYPETEGSDQAEEILSATRRQSDALAQRKLHEALRAPVRFDQRWRRLKEILRDYPKSPAASEAERLFEQHAARIPPVSITNQTAEPVEITVDVPYEAAEFIELAPGETESIATAFPMMVRVQIAEREWQPYRASAGQNYVLRQHADLPPLFIPAP